MSTDNTDLSKALDKIEAHLATTEGDSQETPADLIKGLTEVAKGAIDLAQTGKEAKAAKKAAKAAELLAKATKDAEKDDDNDDKDDKDDDDLPAWLRDVVKDGKAAGDQAYSPDREDTGLHRMTNAGGESRSMAKAYRGKSEDTIVIDEEYFGKSLAYQERIEADTRETNRLVKGLVQEVLKEKRRRKAQGEQIAMLSKAAAISARALGAMLAQREAILETPKGSKYAAMEKSMVAVRTQMEANGATKTPYNKELASRSLQKGLLTNDQHRMWKQTGYLPANVNL